MKIRQILLITLLAGLTVFAHGCIVVAVGVGALGAAGTVAYIKGELKATESENIDIVYESTLLAVNELELKIIYKSKDALSAEINLRDAQDDKVQIALSSTAEHSTEISIRIGTFGDQTKSNLIYQKIRDKLKEQKAAKPNE
jgi:hypothetical protein